MRTNLAVGKYLRSEYSLFFLDNNAKIPLVDSNETDSR